MIWFLTLKFIIKCNIIHHTPSILSVVNSALPASRLSNIARAAECWKLRRLTVNNSTLSLPHPCSLLAAATARGCQVPHNDLVAEGRSMGWGTLYLDQSVLWSDPTGLEPLLQCPHRVVWPANSQLAIVLLVLCWSPEVLLLIGLLAAEIDLI